MIIKRKKTLDERYEEYKRDYYKKQERVQGYGGEMHDSILTREQFKDRYTRFYNFRLEQKEKGTRSSIGNITEDIINNQAYDPRMSYGKAKQILEWYFQKNGIDRSPTIIDIQALRVKGATDLMKEFFNSKKEEIRKGNPTLTSKEINRLASQEVGQEFFHSPNVA